MGTAHLRDKIIVDDGTVIFKQGDEGVEAFVVQKGNIQITKEVAGETISLGVVSVGQMFGEMAIIDGSRRTATARAIGRTQLLRVPKWTFEQKLDDCDPLLRSLITKYIKNLREAATLYHKRPRSLEDHLTMLHTYSVGMRTYVNKYARSSDFAGDMVDALSDLEASIARVRIASHMHDDRRDSIIGPEDTKGMTLQDFIVKG